MALIKTDSRILNASEDIKRFAAEAEQATAFPAFNRGLSQWLHDIENPCPDIAVYYFSTPSEQAIQMFTHWLLPPEHRQQAAETMAAMEAGIFPINTNGLNYRICLSPFEKVQSLGFGALKPVFAICLLSQHDVKEQDWQEKLLSLAGDTPWLKLWSEAAMPEMDNARDFLKLQMMQVELASTEDFMEGTSFIEWIQKPEFQGKLQAGFQYTAMQALDTLFSVFALSLEQEERNLKARKMMNQQQVMGLQGQNLPSVYDLTGHCKNLIQQQLSQAEKAVTDSLENSIRPQVGPLIKEVESFLEELTELETMKASKQNILKIPAAKQEAYLALMRRFYLKQGQEQLIMIRDILKSLEADIEKYLSKQGIPAETMNIRYLTDEQLRIALESALRWEKEYEGAVGRKGPYEYFMATRKYQMLFFMLASTFGLTFLRNLRLYMIPLSILLMGVGGFAVWRSVEKENADNDVKELDKARESLRAETKRIGSEISRQWGRHASEYLRSLAAQLQSSIEQNIKNHLQHRQSSDEEARKKVQRQVQNLDNFDKKLSSLARNKETTMRNIVKLKSDYRQVFLQESKRT